MRDGCPHPADFRFAVSAVDPKSAARLGRLHTPRGDVDTPAFMPVGTRAAVKGLLPSQVRETGAQILLANTFHLLLRPGPDLVRQMGGVSKWMNWNGPVLTDSGGYQVFSLGNPRKAQPNSEFGTRNSESGTEDSEPEPRGAEHETRNSKPETRNSKHSSAKPLRTVDDDGVTFRSPVDGSQVRMTPESAVDVQLALGADIIMAFDECPPHPCSPAELERAVGRTTAWAGRCAARLRAVAAGKDESLTRARPTADGSSRIPAPIPALFGITQGGLDRELRRRSAAELRELDFPGYAIGGLSVGEPPDAMAELLGRIVGDLPVDRPRYLMGVGTPLDIVRAVGAGVDMFDCVLPTRNGRNAFAFTRTGTLRLRNEQYRADERPLDGHCACQACRGFSRSYLRHLFMTDEMSGPILVSLHNLTYYQDLMRSVREAIRAGSFVDLARQTAAVWSGAAGD